MKRAVTNRPRREQCGPAGAFLLELRSLPNVRFSVFPPMIQRLLLPALLAIACPVSAADEGPTGEAIYRDMCARCHGEKGEGVPKKYEDALYGERSVPSLTKYIDKTMPDDDPDKLDAA